MSSSGEIHLSAISVRADRTARRRREGISGIGLALINVDCPGIDVGACPGSLGCSPADVPFAVALQRELVYAGFGERLAGDGGVTGEFGPGSVAALAAWSASTGVAADFGPVMWAAFGLGCS